MSRYGEKMSDLSHWDGTASFSADEAAALAVGVDPADPQAQTFKAAPTLARMREGHRIARAFVSQVMTPEEFVVGRRNPQWRDALVSELFDLYPDLQKEPWPSDPDRPYELPRRFRGEDGNFETQRFARVELHRWFAVVGIKAAYQFCGDQGTGSTPLDPVPHELKKGTLWPAHETVALTALRRACEKFWKNYDPQDQSTAPKKEEVVDWIVKNHEEISRSMADSMASILRANDLKPGPR
jgi:hypothetical protein